jgi:hypothetical protein
MTPELDLVRAGSIVEVWDRPLGRFHGPFRVTDAGPTGIRVQPVDEPHPLPDTFAPDELRLVRAQRPSAAG